MNEINTVEDYISSFPKDVQSRLKGLRAVIKAAAPEAEESISYRMPYYSLHGRLLYFAGHEHHIGFYLLTAAMKAFKEELSAYKQGKGSVQFPHDKPLPLAMTKTIPSQAQKTCDGRKDRYHLSSCAVTSERTNGVSKLE